MASIMIYDELDNHKKIQDEQDKTIERIKYGVDNLKTKAETINIVIEEDKKILVPVEKNIDNVSGKISRLNNKVKNLIDSTDDKYKFCFLGVLFLILVILLFIYLYQNS
jgi:hypothetical protein